MKRIIFTVIICVLMCMTSAAQTMVGQSIMFSCDSIDVAESQVAQVEMMAQYFKAHPRQMFFIGGFTSEQTPKERVETVCLQRADAVKKMLEERFGVDCKYIFAVGIGVSTKSDDPAFNEKVVFFKK